MELPVDQIQSTRPMNAVIHRVKPGSIAEALGLCAGDTLLAVNQRSNLEDLFDWQLEVSDSEYLELTVRRTGGSEEIFEIEKDAEEDLGIIFASPIFTPTKTCNNACPFCFIDQQPEGLRSTLYVKDDDYRLSYFNNTYITLTNLTPRDVARIETLRPGPLYVSVHATQPEVRAILLQNPKGGNIMEKLTWLKSLEIPFHAQVVVCPGINDGEILENTLRDLASLRPEALSVAVVPVGLTQYRGSLANLVPVTSETAKNVIDRVDGFVSALGDDGFVFLSDEFYFMADRPLPQYQQYGDFPQLDDGVGPSRMLQAGFWALEPSLPQRLDGSPKNILVLSGKLGAMVLQPIVQRLNAIDGLYLDLQGVESHFWGEQVTVAGLITGQDILKSLAGQDLAGYRYGILPSIMLRHGNQVFLDDLKLSDLEAQLGLPIRVVQDPYDAQEFVNLVLGDMQPHEGQEKAPHPLERWVR